MGFFVIKVHATREITVAHNNSYCLGFKGYQHMINNKLPKSWWDQITVECFGYQIYYLYTKINHVFF